MSKRVKRNYPNLSRAPIIEALIDIRVKFLEIPSTQVLDKLHDQISSDFPEKKARGISKFTIGNNEGLPHVSPEIAVNGYVCFSSDQKKAVQFRTDGFTFSFLKTYSSCEEIKPESEKYWKLYKLTTKPISIERLAVRYINSIKIPSPINDYSKYFKISSKLPENISGKVKQFLNMFVVSFDQGVQANVTLTSKPTEVPGFEEFLFDIDVFKDVNDQAIDMWAIFDYFKEVKNQIFFESITKETERLFR